MDELTYVKFYAAKKHFGQDYGVLPYTHHLEDVEEVLRRFGVNEINGMPLLKAAWLHDVVEDTPTRTRDIEELFGEEVARLVEAVTSEPGENRKIRNALTYPKIRAAGKDAVMLKLADRIANMENAGAALPMYKKEFEDFYRALYTEGEHENMWHRIKMLAGK